MKKNFTLVSMLLGTAMLCKPKDSESPEAGGKATPAPKSEGDNIEEEIDKGVNLAEDVAEAAAQQISKENKERRVDETKRLMMKSAYIRGKQLLVLRRNKRIKEAAKEYLTTLTNLDEALKKGKHDVTSYNVEFKEAYKKRNEALHAIDKTYNDYCVKLRNLYPSYYCYDWDYNVD